MVANLTFLNGRNGTALDLAFDDDSYYSGIHLTGEMRLELLFPRPRLYVQPGNCEVRIALDMLAWAMPSLVFFFFFFSLLLSSSASSSLRLANFTRPTVFSSLQAAGPASRWGIALSFPLLPRRWLITSALLAFRMCRQTFSSAATLS